MIPNHKQFIEAINEKKKVSLRFYSKADSGVIDLVCAPMDYGPVGEIKDGVNRYQFWDYSRNNGSPLLFLLPEQVLGLSLLSVTSNTGPMLNWQWTSGSVQIKGHVYLHYSR